MPPNISLNYCKTLSRLKTGLRRLRLKDKCFVYAKTSASDLLYSSVNFFCNSNDIGW